MEHFSFYESDTFIACFSEEADLLSQWRGYAQDGTGVFIGFSKKVLSTLEVEHYTAFKKVTYGKSEQSEYIESIVSNLDNTPVFYGISNLYQNERLNIPFYKNPAFRERKRMATGILPVTK